MIVILSASDACTFVVHWLRLSVRSAGALACVAGALVGLRAMRSRGCAGGRAGSSVRSAHYVNSECGSVSEGIREPTAWRNLVACCRVHLPVLVLGEAYESVGHSAWDEGLDGTARDGLVVVSLCFPV